MTSFFYSANHTRIPPDGHLLFQVGDELLSQEQRDAEIGIITPNLDGRLL